MDNSIVFIITLTFAIGSYFLGRGTALRQAERLGGVRFLSALPLYYGIVTLLWTALPALILLGFWYALENTVIEHLVVRHLPESVQATGTTEVGLALNKIRLLLNNQMVGEPQPYMFAAAAEIVRLEQVSKQLLVLSVVAAMLIAATTVLLRISPKMRARVQVEYAFRLVLLASSLIAILTTLGIFFSLFFESLQFFRSTSIGDFLFGRQWSPQSAINNDQTLAETSFGALPLFYGTAFIAIIAMLVALPVGLMTAIYLTEYAPKKVRDVVKPALEILAGIPTVVYGFFAALTVAPLVRDIALASGLNTWLTVSSESALAAGVVVGIMVVPFVSSISDDVINAVPQSLRDCALALGSTKSEVIKHVVLPAAVPGIAGGFLLAASRAIGETMIVVMAAGLTANITLNPLDSVTTVTAQIVNLLTGNQQLDNPKILAAFALGLTLFLVTLVLNYIALRIVKRYRTYYE